MGAPVPWWNPFAGLPALAQPLLWFLLAVTLVAFAAVAHLVVRAVRERRVQRSGRRRTSADDFLWVFVVPALNEEVTIADSVRRLVAVEAAHKAVVVIDDGSDDATPDILRALQAEIPELMVLTRQAPHARKGKGAGLDHAWEYVHAHVLGDPRYAGWPASHVVVGIVDADGRIAPDAPRRLSGVFSDERVGGVQSLVRIYNRRHPLTWAQDVEFAITAHVFQLGRSRLGIANMGGNGQYMRLAALDDVVATDHLPDGVERGPWRDRLTEDQDIGVRLVHTGRWRGAQTVATAVEQQGLTSLRRLWRQRVRWAQGAWQVLPELRRARHAGLRLPALLDHVVYLLAPLLHLLMSVGVVKSAVFFLVWDVPFFGPWWPTPVFLVAVTVLPAFVALLLSGPPGPRRVLRAVVGLLPYLLYTWLLLPVFAVSLVRELAGRRGWDKTAREPLDANAASEELRPSASRSSS